MDKQIDEKTLRKYYMQAFTGEAGTMVLKDLQNRCHKRDTTHVPGDRDATHVNEGKRQVLLHIESMMSEEGIANLAKEPEEGRE